MGIDISAGGRQADSESGSALDSERSIQITSCSLLLDTASLAAAAAFGAMTSGRPALPPATQQASALAGSAPGAPCPTPASRLHLQLSQLTLGLDMEHSIGIQLSDLDYTSPSTTQQVRVCAEAVELSSRTSLAFQNSTGELRYLVPSGGVNFDRVTRCIRLLDNERTWHTVEWILIGWQIRRIPLNALIFHFDALNV